MIPLTRPLVVLDVETTGTDTQRDRIVSLAMLTFHPDGREERHKTLVNPGVPIPKDATTKHGLTDAEVTDAPRFGVLAPRLSAALSLVDFAGCNVTFDLRILQAEFGRCSIKWTYEDAKILDAYRLEQLLDPRTLSDLVRKRCQREPTAAHTADGDVTDAWDVIVAQLRQPELNKTLDELHALQFPPVPGALDKSGHLTSRDGIVCWNRGKHKGAPLSEIDKGYLRWILENDFPLDTKTVIKQELARR